MLTTAMARLVDRITASMDTTADDRGRAAAAAAHLAAVLGSADLLGADDCAPDPRCYCQHVVYVDPRSRFSVVALVWLPGQATAIHDHACWCVVGVHRGCEEEARFRLVEGPGAPRHLQQTGSVLNDAGSVCALVPTGTDIHRVGSVAAETTISIHVYGADIAARGSSIRIVYPETMLEPVRAAG